MEQIVLAFEKAWLQGQRPALEAHLPAAETLRQAVLVELIHADLECRLKAGEPARVENYLERYPDLGQDPGRVVDLLATEFRCRRRADPQLGPDEYTRRFPHLGEAIVSQLQARARQLQPDTIVDRKRSTRATSELSPPEVLGYEILGELGRGGMGVVYRARQQSVNRLVALKMILTGSHAGPQELARFRAEAEAFGSLQHPNIVQIYEVGQHEGWPFLSLELVEGPSLAERLDGTPAPALQAAALIETLARAVHWSHERGIIHRDLKPANVLLSFSREPVASAGPALAPGSRLNDCIPKITDFGLAKRLPGEPGTSATGGSPVVDVPGSLKSAAGSPARTQTGAIVGTPSYMAPEQGKAQAGQVGPPTDVYALGAILYELLTGRPPFKAETPLDTLMLVIAEEPVPPLRLQPKVPRDLETVCLKCLRKEPSRRYPTAAALAEDLHRFQAGEPIQARPVGLLERGRKWACRRPALAALIGVSAAALLCLVAGGWWYQERLRDSLDQVEQERDRVAAAGRAEQQARRQAEQQLVHFHVNNGMQALDEGDAFGALPYLLQALRLDQGGSENIRRHRIRLAAVFQQCPQLVRIWSHDKPLTRVVCSPNGRLVVTTSEDHTARVWDMAGGQEVTGPLRHEDVVLQAAFSPDSKRLVTACRDGKARLWQVAAGKLLHKLSHNGAVLHAEFSPDGRRVVTASYDRTARVWDAVSGDLIARYANHTKEVLMAAFSPDGRHMVTASTDGTAQVWDSATGVGIAALVHKAEVWHAAFSPDGQHLLTASQDGTARLWPVVPLMPTSLPREQVKKVNQATLIPSPSLWSVEHPDGVNHAAFSPDGSWVVTAGKDRTARLWSAATGTLIGQPLVHRHQIQRVAVSPDGRWILTVSGDQSVRVWEAYTGQALTPPLPHLQEVRDASFTPAGHRLVTASQDRMARLWDLAKEPSPKLILRHRNEVNSAVFSPDGKRLVTASDDGTAQVWDTATGETLAPALHHKDCVLRALFSPNGRRVITTSKDQTARVWDAATGQPVTPRLRHAAAVWHAAFSADSRHVITASADCTARLWEAATGQIVTLPLKHAEWPKGNQRTHARPPREKLFDRKRFDFGQRSPKTRWTPVARIEWPDNQADAPSDWWNKPWPQRRSMRPIQLAQVPETIGEQPPPPIAPVAPVLRRFFNPENEIHSVGFSPDGRWVVTGGSDHSARIWNVKTGKALYSPLKLSGPVFHASFTANGKHILAAAGNQAQVWDVKTGNAVIPPLMHTGTVYRADFDPSGRYIITASADRMARIWDARSGRPLTAPLKHSWPVFQVAFGHGGRRVLTVCLRYARVWDSQTGEPLGPALVHGHDLTYGAFSPDGRRVATAGRDGTVRVWDISAAEQRSLPELTRQVQVLSGRLLDPQGGFIPIEVSALKESARSLRAPDGPGRTWNLRQAAEAEREGQWFAVVWHLGRLLQTHNNDAALYTRRARAYSQLQSWQKVLADCDKAQELGDDGARLYFLRGRALDRLGHARQALSDYTTALERQPDEALWLARHSILARLGRPAPPAATKRPVQPARRNRDWFSPWAEVADDLTTRIERGECAAWAWRARGTAYLRLGNWKGAAEDLVKSLRANDDAYDVRVLLALAQLASGGPAARQADLAGLFFRWRQRSEESATLPLLFLLRPSWPRDILQMVEHAKKAGTARPRNFDDRLNLGAALYRAGKLKEARQALLETVQLRSEAPAAWLFLALTCRDQDLPEEAQKWLDRASDWIDQATSAAAGPTRGSAPKWQKLLELRILLREAEGPAQPMPKENRERI
jgi:WD40 repeat protein/serine/threonine protein kinase/tetratricopeptide (TPR) repeat protein